MAGARNWSICKKTRIRFICVAQIILNNVYKINSSGGHKNVSGPKQRLRCLFFRFYLTARAMAGGRMQRSKSALLSHHLHILITECKRRRRPVSCNCPPRSLIFELLIKQSNTKISPCAQLHCNCLPLRMQIYCGTLLRTVCSHALRARASLLRKVIYGLTLNYNASAEK